jgi:hypothetical protein
MGGAARSAMFRVLVLGGFLALVGGLPAPQDPRPASAGALPARGYFDFRRDLPADATLRRLSDEFFADAACSSSS